MLHAPPILLVKREFLVVGLLILNLIDNADRKKFQVGTGIGQSFQVQFSASFLVDLVEALSAKILIAVLALELPLVYLTLLANNYKAVDVHHAVAVGVRSLKA